MTVRISGFLLAIIVANIVVVLIGLIVAGIDDLGFFTLFMVAGAASGLVGGWAWVKFMLKPVKEC